MAGPPHPLQKGVDRARRADLAGEVHVSDVDAELQGSGRHQHLQFTALQALLRVQSAFLGEAAVMCRHILFAQSFG